MASRTDLIMAEYEKDIALDKLSEEEKIEKDKSIRAMDTITAMSEGAQMGMAVGEGIGKAVEGTKEFIDGAKFTADKFKQRAKVKEDFIGKYGRKAWRRGGLDDKGQPMMAGREMRKQAFSDNTLDDKDMISMYLEGVNDYKTNANGTVTSHADDGETVNVNDYKSVRNFKTPSVSSNIPEIVGGAVNWMKEDIKDAPRQLKEFGKNAWDAVRNDPSDPDDWYLTKWIHEANQRQGIGKGGLMGYAWDRWKKRRANKDFEEIISTEQETE